MTSSDYVISTARERLQAWARNQNKTITQANGDYTISRIKTPLADAVNKYSETFIAIIACSSAVAIVAVGIYFYLKRKKEQ